MLRQVGHVGFLLLLFEVGLEIELPPLRTLRRPILAAGMWVAVQYPVLLCISAITGMEPREALIAAASLTACSVGLAHAAWKGYPGFQRGEGDYTLQVMVALELIAVAVLAVETAALDRGSPWVAVLRVAGILAVVAAINFFSRHLSSLFQTIIARTTLWRLHFIILAVLVICAMGDRLGLSATKTAFVLGLFLSRARHDGLVLEDYIAPVSRRLFIPVFFVGLGTMIQWPVLFSWTGPLAIGTAFLLLGIREVLHRRWLPVGGDRLAYLLLCPNLTIVALGAGALIQKKRSPETVGWLTMTGFIMTVVSILLLPKSRPGSGVAEDCSP